MDAETLRAVAIMCDQRARRATVADARDRRDGLERLGATKALEQLAKDLRATADEFDRDHGAAG